MRNTMHHIKRSLVSAAVALLAAASPSNGQITPDRAYFGVNRPIPMRVAVPGGRSGAVAIELLAPGQRGSVDATVVARADAEAGGVDLAGLFPILWTSDAPRVLYAQLVVGDSRVGPAVVLQPLLTPKRARLAGNQVQFPDVPGRVYSGLRAYTDAHIVLDTSEGEIEVALRPDHAPNTVWSIRSLVEGGYYTDIIVHRVVPNVRGNPFVVQFGDPTGVGSGGPGYFTDLEPSALPHDFGVLSMARTNDPDTNGSQIFICLSRAGTSFLDVNYVSFGQTVRGGDAILRIERTPLEAPNSQRPAEPPVVRSARLEPAPPYGNGPAPIARPGGVSNER